MFNTSIHSNLCIDVFLLYPKNKINEMYLNTYILLFIKNPNQKKYINTTKH